MKQRIPWYAINSYWVQSIDIHVLPFFHKYFFKLSYIDMTQVNHFSLLVLVLIPLEPTTYNKIQGKHASSVKTNFKHLAPVNALALSTCQNFTQLSANNRKFYQNYP